MDTVEPPAPLGAIFDAEGRNTANTRCHQEARQGHRAPYKSAPIAFAIDIDLGCDASKVDKRRLIATAAKGCLIKQSLKPGIVTHRLKVDDNWVGV